MADEGAGGRQRAARAVLFVLAAAVFGSLFTVGVHHASRLNDNPESNDQGSYEFYVTFIHKDSDAFLYNRNRMPVVPYLVSLVTPHDAARPEIFRAGKRVNAVIALVGLLALALLTWRWLGGWAALATTLMAAFTVFVFKAPFIQAEVLFYLLFALAGCGMVALLRRPRPMLGALVGLGTGLTQLTKSGTLPIIGVFAVCCVAAAAWYLRSDRARALRHLLTLASFALLFVLTVAPYAANSKRVYGSYTYNTNTTYYAWYDSWAEAEAGTQGHRDEAGPPQLPASELPSASRYLREHSVQEVLYRFRRGVGDEVHDAWHGSGFAPFVLLEALAALALVVWQRKRVWASVRRDPVTPLFVLGTGLLFVALFGWWMPISRGNRFVLTLFLPTVLALGWVIRRLGTEVVGQVRDRPVSASDAVFAALSLLLTAQALHAVFSLTHHVYGGY